MSALTELQRKAKRKKYIISHLPENLENLIQGKKKIPYKGKNLKTSYLVDIVHTLLTKHFQTDRITFNMDSRIFREKYAQNYSYYLKYLIENNILEMISDYYVGKKSKTYKIPEQTLKNIKSYKNEDNILLKKYRKFYTLNYIKNINYKYISFESRVKLIQYIDKVDIKYVEAEEYLKSLKLTDDQKVKNFHSILSLKHNDLWYNFDSYGRFHSNFTTLKSEIRNEFLLIDGEPTMEIDITNSQPIFLSFLMRNYLEIIDKEEYEFFKQLVVTGKLYEYVSNHTGKTRKEIKKMIYVVLFGTNHLNKKENKIFNSLFPSIFQFIRWYKKEEGSHKSMSYELQRSESNFLFNDVIEEILTKYPDMPFFTVHDSITVKQKDYDKVKKIFDEHIDKLHKRL